jgi:C4-dicarboxylate-specific signal transduction histidine kinase
LLRSLAAPDATLSMVVAPGLPVLPFAAEVLERILVNLTRNAATALRAHPPQDVVGRIRIVVSGDAMRLSLTVADNGPGMPPEIAVAFLKPAALPQGAIRGLGHRVVGNLVQSTGGQLSISVAPKGGTTLRIDWPLSPKQTKNAVRRHTSCGHTAMPRSSKRTVREGAVLSC